MSGWSVDSVGEALVELAALPKDILAKFERILRMTGRDGIARAIYFTAAPKRVIVARVFVKKTQKTPRGEIETALKRMKDWHDDNS